MSDETAPKGRVVRRTGERRRRVQGGRRGGRYDVTATVEEDALLRGYALRERVSIPRLLVESAMAIGAGNGETPTQRREIVTEFAAAVRLLAQVSNNVNQVAHAFNTVALVMRSDERIDDELVQRFESAIGAMPTLLEKVREIAERLDETAETIAVPGAG